MPVRWVRKRAASVPAKGAGAMMRRAPSSSMSRGGVMAGRYACRRTARNATLVQCSSVARSCPPERVIGRLIREAQSTFRPEPRVASRGVAVLTLCPSCGSGFLQPLRCEAKSADVVMVELRCSDCMTWLKAPHTKADMRELDRRQAEFRAEIVAQYVRSVAESMEALAACLGPALALDLVSADDFAPSRAARSAGGGR